MQQRTTQPRPSARTYRLVHGPALALVAVALAMVLGGCIQGHDPRTDGSMAPAHGRVAMS